MPISPLVTTTQIRLPTDHAKSNVEGQTWQTALDDASRTPDQATAEANSAIPATIHSATHDAPSRLDMSTLQSLTARDGKVPTPNVTDDSTPEVSISPSVKPASSGVTPSPSVSNGDDKDPTPTVTADPAPEVSVSPSVKPAPSGVTPSPSMSSGDGKGSLSDVAAGPTSGSGIASPVKPTHPDTAPLPSVKAGDDTPSAPTVTAAPASDAGIAPPVKSAQPDMTTQPSAKTGSNQSLVPSSEKDLVSTAPDNHITSPTLTAHKDKKEAVQSLSQNAALALPLAPQAAAQGGDPSAKPASRPEVKAEGVTNASSSPPVSTSLNSAPPQTSSPLPVTTQAKANARETAQVGQAALPDLDSIVPPVSTSISATSVPAPKAPAEKVARTATPPSPSTLTATTPPDQKASLPSSPDAALNQGQGTAPKADSVTTASKLAQFIAPVTHQTASSNTQAANTPVSAAPQNAASPAPATTALQGRGANIASSAGTISGRLASPNAEGSVAATATAATRVATSTFEALTAHNLAVATSGLTSLSQNESDFRKTLNNLQPFPAVTTTGGLASVSTTAGVNKPLPSGPATAIPDVTNLAPAALSATITALHQSGQNAVTLRLDPPNLGHLMVQLKMDAQGAVNVLFVPGTVDAAHALQNTLPQLSSALAQSGLTLGQAEVGGQFSQSGGQNNNPQSGYTASPQQASATMNAAPTAAPPPRLSGLSAYA